MANEKRLIDANALLEKIQFRRPVIDTETKIVSDCVQIARKAIVDAPTVDAVEVVHGRWVWVDDEECGIYRCSCCHGAGGYPTNYCPNCGAKMDGDKDSNLLFADMEEIIDATD